MTETRYPAVLSDVENLYHNWRDVQLLTKKILTEKLSIARSQFTSKSKMTADLGGDSLDLVEIAIALEKITGVRINERVPFYYVVEIVDYLHFVRTWAK